MAKQITYVRSDYIDSHTDYSPADLMKIAEEMRKEGYESINVSVESEYGEHYLRCYVTRLETESEEQARLRQEVARQQQNENYERATFERLRKKFEQKS